MPERRINPPCDIHTRDIEELRCCVFGNGDEGLKTKTIRMGERMDSLKHDMKMMRIFLYSTLPPILIGVLSIAVKIIIF